MLYQYNEKKLKPQDIPYLHGIISHVRNIEPEHFEKLRMTYGEEFFLKLAKQSFFISDANKKLIVEKKSKKSK